MVCGAVPEDRRSEGPTCQLSGAAPPPLPLQEFLYRTAGGLSYWIGLTKAGSEGDWSWVDDTPFDKVQSAQ